MESNIRKFVIFSTNTSLRAISPFPNVFSKELHCRHTKPGFAWEKVKKIKREEQVLYSAMYFSDAKLFDLVLYLE